MDNEEKKLADAYDRGLLKTEDPSDDLLAEAVKFESKYYRSDIGHREFSRT